jgi:hypothetical protein
MIFRRVSQRQAAAFYLGFFVKCIPLVTVRALSKPFGCLMPAEGTGENGFWFGHSYFFD